MKDTNPRDLKVCNLSSTMACMTKQRVFLGAMVVCGGGVEFTFISLK